MGIHVSYEKAVDLLREISNSHGFLASCTDKSNYRRIWSRDGVVAGIASIMSEDKKLIKTFEKHLVTLKKFQDSTGRIPSNVDLDKNDVSYGTLVGKVDASLWYVIGVGQYYKFTKDKKFLKDFIESVKLSMNYLESLELNGKGLLFIPTGGDWADEYITHGYVLFDQLLYLQALKEYLFMLKSLRRSHKEIKYRIGRLKQLILVNYFPSEKKSKRDEVYHRKLYTKLLDEFKEKHGLMYFSSDGFSRRLDSFANSLLLHFEILDGKKKKNLIDSLEFRLNRQKLKILPAFWPPIKRRSHFWPVLKMNSLFEFRNKPHHYHNGGLWPLVQGFFISGLIKNSKKSVAKKHLEEFSLAMEKDNYRFYEYFDSKRYKGNGIVRHGFSAAGYVIAYLSVVQRKVVFR